MKRLFSTALAVLIMSAPAAAANDVNVYLNDSLIEAKGVIAESRTLVPVRGVFEGMGYEVEWDGNTKTATLTNTDKNSTVTLTNGMSSFTVDDREIIPDVPQQIIDGRFMLPLRAIGEALGAEVKWEPDTKSVKITNNVEKISENTENAETKENTEDTKEQDTPKGNFSIPEVTIEEVDPFTMEGPVTDVEF